MIFTFANHCNSLGTSSELENDVDYSIDSEIKMDLTEEIIPSENPWSVPNVSEFLKYCCPECEYSDQNLDDFSEHAIGLEYVQNIFSRSLRKTSLLQRKLRQTKCLLFNF